MHHKNQFDDFLKVIYFVKEALLGNFIFGC